MKLLLLVKVLADIFISVKIYRKVFKTCFCAKTEKFIKDVSMILENDSQNQNVTPVF